jgi:hypothetical protein
MAFTPFPSDEQAIKALQKEASNAALLSTFAAQNPTFTQYPKNIVANERALLYKVVLGVDIVSKGVITGILVGYVCHGHGVVARSPVIYSKDANIGTGINRLFIADSVVPLLKKTWLTSPAEKMCKYLESKGYKLFYDREKDPRVTTEHDRHLKGTFKTYTIYNQDKVWVLINIVGQGLPFISTTGKTRLINSLAQGVQAPQSDSFVGRQDQTNWNRLVNEPAAFSYALAYPNMLEHNTIVRHSLASSSEYEQQTKNTIANELKYSENIQDFTPTIQFNDFLRFYKPEDIDNLEKVITYSTEVILKGRNTLPVKILSAGWNNVVTKNAPPVPAQPTPTTQPAAPAGIGDAALFEELRLTLINLVCSHGIKHHHVNGVDIILYNNQMLTELIKRLEIPSYTHKVEGTEYQKAGYEKYAKFSWHKYAIAKLLLPPYVIEYKGETILPIEAYIHHAYLVSRVGKFLKPEGMLQTKVQSEIRAFISAIKAASNYPDLTPSEVARILNIALGFNI